MSASDQSLGAIVMEALRQRDRMRSEGLSEEDLARSFETLIRDVWPKPHTRTTPWHYLCELCNDTGLRMFVCRRGRRCHGISTRTDGPFEKPGKYRRLCKLNPDSDYEHDYGEPCGCARGDRLREKPKDAADFAEAGKTPSKPTRWGR